MGGKVNARQQHEENRNRLHRRRVKKPKTGVMGRKAAQSHDGKGMHQCIHGGHASQPKTAYAAGRNKGIDNPQALGGLGDAGC